MDDGKFNRAILSAETGVGRTLVHIDSQKDDDISEILSYKDMESIVRGTGWGTLVICCCRHDALHLGKVCRFPLDICMSIYTGADFILRHHFGRRADSNEVIDILENSRDMVLVFICYNVKRRPSFIFQCCS